MKFTSLFALIFFLIFAPSTSATEWVKSETPLPYTPGTIEFFNRSACAKKAKEPTESVFLIVDNVSIAKAAFRLARSRQEDTVTVTDLGIQKFRFSLTSLVQIIGDKLLSGKLPLLPMNRDKIADPEMRAALIDCEAGSCQRLNERLAQNWQAASAGSQDKKRIACKVIKKFSTLNSHLRISKPDRVLLSHMAKELEQPQEFTEECQEVSTLTQPEVALYQFDLETKGAEISFKKRGFDYWHTLKIYLSWAYRHSPEMKQLAWPFQGLFQSGNLEEMVLFFSNGCRSIKPDTCSATDLTMNRLRSLTTPGSSLDWARVNQLKPVPDSTPDDLFSKPLPLMDQDLLNLGDQQTADAWTANFRDNFVKARGFNKLKLLKAINQLKLITGNVSAETILERLKKDRADKAMLPSLYYLCSEYNVAASDSLSSIPQDLARLKELNILDPILKELKAPEMESFWNSFIALSSAVQPFCQELDKDRSWEQNEVAPKKEGFANWYKQVVYDQPHDFKDPLSLSGLKSERPFLSLKNGEVICPDAVHCSRQVLDAMMALSAVSQSLSILAPDNSAVSSNNMANPYADHMACKAYDPFGKRNQIIYDFFHDLAQSAVFGLLPTPVYVAANLDPKRVVSFNTLVKEGKVHYDPKFNQNRLKLSLIADFGPLLGVPCAVSVSGAKINPYQYYMFNGLSFTGCKERTSAQTTMAQGAEGDTTQSFRQMCGTCAINLQTMSATASHLNPALRVGYFLVKGVVKLISGLRDQIDLSRDWKIRPQQVLLTHRAQGDISKSCSQNLLRGESCFDDCEGEVMEELSHKYHLTPLRTRFSCENGKATLTVKECADPIRVTFNSEGKNPRLRSDCKLKERL